MNSKFEIIDGIVYVEKNLFEEAQNEDNNISKLVGSPSVNLFKTRPRIITGVESVTIDYRFADEISVDIDPTIFVKEIQSLYDYRVRGHLIVDVGDHQPQDMLINRY